MKKIKMKEEEQILAISFGLAFIFIILALLRYFGIFSALHYMDFVVFAILSITGIYGFHEYKKEIKIKRIDEALPDLLIDLAESTKAGMTLFNAIKTASYGKYGELTEEIKTMSNQLSWGLQLNEVLQRFADRVRTPLVRRTVSLIIETNNAGGNISDVLMSAAIDSREIRSLNTERKLTMSLYIAIVYVAFAIFLLIIVILALTLTPQFTTIQGMFKNVPSNQQPSWVSNISQSFVLLIYYWAALIQGLGDGLIGGTLSEGRASAGVKHSFIMVLIVYVVFKSIGGF